MIGWEWYALQMKKKVEIQVISDAKDANH